MTDLDALTAALPADEPATRCRRSRNRSPCGGVVGADQRCAACGAWREPVMLLSGPASFDSPELHAAIARPIPGERR